MGNKLQQQGTTLNKQRCKSCPFGGDQSVGGNDLAIHLIVKNGLHGSHYCHQQQFQGEEPTRFCRGHRDVLLQILFAKGWLNEPTDEEFDRVSNEIAEGNFQQQEKQSDNPIDKDQQQSLQEFA